VGAWGRNLGPLVPPGNPLTRYQLTHELSRGTKEGAEADELPQPAELA
jgi:hypothetical protein